MTSSRPQPAAAITARRAKAGLGALLVVALVAGCGGTQSDRSAAPVPAPAPDAAAGTGTAPEAPVGTPTDSAAPGGVTGAAPSVPSLGAPSTAPAAGAPSKAAGSSTPAAAKPSARPGASSAASPGAASPGGAANPAPGTPTPGGGGGGELPASDVGVTAGTIKLGTIGSISGAMPGQFLPSIQAAQAYFNDLNEQGGINGRKVSLSVQDDGLDGTKNLAAAKRLIEDEKVFAIVSETSPVQDASGRYLHDQKVPVTTNGAIGNAAALYPNIYSMLGVQRTGVWTTVLSDYGRQFGNRCGVIDLSIAISQQSGTGQEQACRQSGMEVPYHATVQVVQPDYTAEITKMRAANLSFVVSLMEVNSNIRMMQAMRRQNYIPNPILFTGYDDAIAQTVPDVMEKSVTATAGAAAVEPDWIARIPELAHMQQAIKRFFPDSRKTLWSIFGWQGAMVVADAARELGPNLTREGLMAKLDGYRSYDFHGTITPQNLKFGERSVFNLCTPLLSFRGGKWTTVKDVDNCGKVVKY